MSGPLQRLIGGGSAVVLSVVLAACVSGPRPGPARMSEHLTPQGAPPAPPLGNAAAESTVRGQLASLRLPFIANEGQVDPRVAFYAPTFAGTLFVTQQGELVYALSGPRAAGKRERGRPSSTPGWSLTETLRGGRVRPMAQNRSTTGVSSFLGNDSARWRPKQASWEQISLGAVWASVTVTLRARERSLEKVFTVHPGGSVERIRVRVAGAHALTVNAEGALVADTGLGPVTFTAPVAYQEQDGVRRAVTVAYRVRGREYSFIVGAHDRGLPLVIDPLLQSTYLGGSGFDQGLAIAIDATTGDVYVAGRTESLDFPGTSGGAQPTSGAGDNAFVARLPTTLASVTQATFLGGSGADEGLALAIHPATGDVYVAGFTESVDFPGTSGGAQPALFGCCNAFVARLPRTLTSLTQATYLGDLVMPFQLAVAIHPMTGDVYVAGGTTSTNFPGRTGGAQPMNGGNHDAFVARLPLTLTSLTQTTYLGGSFDDGPFALAIHPTSGDVYVAGGTISGNFPGTAGGAQPTFGGVMDAFVARLPRTLTSLTQATFLGGSRFDVARGLAIHPTTGDVYLAGSAQSTDVPGIVGGAQPAGGQAAFVAQLNAALTSLIGATSLGVNDVDEAWSVAIHPATGDVYVAGVTASTNFPGTSGGAQPASAGHADGFVARLSSALVEITQATYLGGSFDDLALALAIHPMTGDVYVAGRTFSSDFPATAGGAQPASGGNGDAFVSRLTFGLAAIDPLFADVSPSHPFFRWIEALGRAQVTGGCATNPPRYCPGLGVTRAQMAVFLERGIHSASFDPPAATGTVFTDVPASHPFAKWIEQLARDGITGGCSTSPLQYCPDVGVTRAEMAVFLLRAEHGAGYEPPAATGTVFTDVPPLHPFAKWIEQLAREGITGGCSTSPPQYCPGDAVTRGQMAVFLVRAFNLPM